MSAFPRLVCPGCGATNIGAQGACLLCQAPLPNQLPVQPATLVTKGAMQEGMTWQIVVIKGPITGRQYQLSDRISLGRDLSSDIRLNDGQVSRKHAVIQHIQDFYVITDQKSSNGTYVNGQRINKPTILAHGTIITIGFTHFRVQAHA